MYHSVATSPVSSDVRAAIVQEAQAINSQRSWWAEGFWFSSDDETTLSGAAKVFLPGYSTSDGGYVEVDPFDDMFMACADIDFILETLARWSQQHGVEWEIEMEGPVGMVNQSGPDPLLREMFATLADEAGYEPSAEESEQRAVQLREEYASRND